jgi:hypothetical protein
MGLHQTKKLLHSKRTVTRFNRLPTEWEKVFANYLSDKGLISRIYRELKKFNSQRINIPMEKWGHELNREVSKEEVQMANKYTKKSSTSLAIKEMQSKTTPRFHLTPVGMAIFKGKTSNTCWRQWDETGTLMYCWWECKLVQTLWKAVWRFLKKQKVELPYDPVIFLLGM